MRSLGFSGCITARSWDALHHLGSYAISLKLFSIANVSQAATGMKALNAIDEEMQEVKNVLENLCTAASWQFPWNYTFRMLSTFLHAISNMKVQLFVCKKAPIVAAFIDYVLQCNVQNCLADTDFLRNAHTGVFVEELVGEQELGRQRAATGSPGPAKRRWRPDGSQV
jgi:hypothetical protein